MDVDYSDHVTLSIETKVVINFPTARFAVLPVCLGITLNQLSATVRSLSLIERLQIYLHESSTHQMRFYQVMAEIPPVAIPLPVDHDPGAPTPAILLSLDPDFTLCMSTTSLLGARAKLEDIPKVEQLILGRLRGWIVDNLVWPKVRVQSSRFLRLTFTQGVLVGQLSLLVNQFDDEFLITDLFLIMNFSVSSS